MTLSREVCLKARTLIAGRLGLDFPDERLADLERGLARAIRSSSLSAPEAYLPWLANAPDEDPDLRRLAAHLTVGETYFFRDRAVFEALEHELLPSLIEERRSQGVRRLRLWSAACATGEEAYSLAILLDRLLPDRDQWSVTLLATDINAEALEVARRGRYREWSLRDAPDSIRDRYLRRHRDQTFEIDPGLRSMVAFAALNLATEAYPSLMTNTTAMDLVLCRNVLMYFTREAQRATVTRLRRALASGGWLVVSPAEASAELMGPLVPVRFPGAIFYRTHPGEGVAPPPPASPTKPVVTHPPPSLDEMGPQPTVAAPSGGETDAPPAAPSDLEQARALADRGRLDEAHRVCEAALTRHRMDPEAYLLLAAIYQERGEIPAALEALRRALYLAPDSAPAHFLLGTLLFRQGKRGRAARCMEAAAALLSGAPRDEPVPGGGGLTAGRLLETARAYLELRG